jgi:hypothetical protein
VLRSRVVSGQVSKRADGGGSHFLYNKTYGIWLHFTVTRPILAIPGDAISPVHKSGVWSAALRLAIPRTLELLPDVPIDAYRVH